MFVCAYSNILNVQRFFSFYAIYLILSLEMSDEPHFDVHKKGKRTFKNVFVPVSHVFICYYSSFQPDVESGLSAYRSGRSTRDIPFLVVTPVILVDEVYEMLEGREGALQLTKTSVLGEVSLS